MFICFFISNSSNSIRFNSSNVSFNFYYWMIYCFKLFLLFCSFRLCSFDKSFFSSLFYSNRKRLARLWSTLDKSILKSNSFFLQTIYASFLYFSGFKKNDWLSDSSNDAFWVPDWFKWVFRDCFTLFTIYLLQPL